MSEQFDELSECAESCDEKSRTDVSYLHSVPPMSNSESMLLQPASVVSPEQAEAADVETPSVTRCGDTITVRLRREGKVVAHSFLNGHMTVGALTPSKRAEFVAQGRVLYNDMAAAGETLYVLCAPYTFQDASLMLGLSEPEFIHVHFSLWREGTESSASD